MANAATRVPRIAAVLAYVSQQQRALDEEFYDEVLEDLEKSKT